jgi:hypothetical protein
MRAGPRIARDPRRSSKEIGVRPDRATGPRAFTAETVTATARKYACPNGPQATSALSSSRTAPADGEARKRRVEVTPHRFIEWCRHPAGAHSWDRSGQQRSHPPNEQRPKQDGEVWFGHSNRACYRIHSFASVRHCFRRKALWGWRYAMRQEVLDRRQSAGSVTRHPCRRRWAP